MIVGGGKKGGWMGLRILDGGLGTELASRGCDISDSLWSARVLLEQPEVIEGVHFDYLRAGAECITTASYQVSFQGFARAGLGREETIRALRESVAVARRARGRFQAAQPHGRVPLIAASVGPYGASLGDGSEYHGNYNCSAAELLAFHEERLNVLIETRPDILACETIPSWEEAEVILRVLRRHPGVPAWFSFTCRDALHTAHGEPLRECAQRLDPESVVAAIGVNCIAPHLAAPLISEIRAVSAKPVVVYPNSGQKWDAVQRCWRGDKAQTGIAALASQWYAAGARWIGGCCGTRPEDIAGIRAALPRKLPQQAS
ncbi:MAG: homocysteine S-methyltransferase [Acidobacteriia bacterium]|nr:homocysteine S-methyltransferase [Terriglobia bacterium]